MKITEPILLVKLSLNQKFPRRILYTRKTALGIGIMKLSIIIAILAIKLYLGYKRSEDRIAQIIKINKENAQIQYRYKDYSIETQREYKLEARI